MDRGSFQSTLVMGNLLMRDPWLQPGIDWKCILGKGLVNTQRRISTKPQPTRIFQYLRMENPGFHLFEKY